MSSEIAISCEGIAKSYVLGDRESSFSSFSDSWRRLFSPKPAAPKQLFWAVDDISFQVNKGEVLGVIGRNGAGKSTLLKILSRIVRPTRGRIRMDGSVGALLEVGTGFHQDLSGRDNIFLNGVILGMRHSDVKRHFDEIVAFADVARFIDTPVKFYSSGMYLRLAFAVASFLQPDILLVDEVLAVGDAAFQQKCLGRMQDVSKEGRTVFFVSHNMSAIESLCPRTLWLDGGKLRRDGKTADVIGEYLSAGSGHLTEREWPSHDPATGNEKVRLHGARIEASTGERPDAWSIRTGLKLQIDYEACRPGLKLNLSVAVYNGVGQHVFSTTTALDPNWHGRPFEAGRYRSSCPIPGDLLNDGQYKIELFFVEEASYVVLHVSDFISFELKDEASARGGWHDRWPGVVRPRLVWETVRVERTESGQGNG